MTPNRLENGYIVKLSPKRLHGLPTKAEQKEMDARIKERERLFDGAYNKGAGSVYVVEGALSAEQKAFIQQWNAFETPVQMVKVPDGGHAYCVVNPNRWFLYDKDDNQVALPWSY